MVVTLLVKQIIQKELKLYVKFDLGKLERSHGQKLIYNNIHYYFQNFIYLTKIIIDVCLHLVNYSIFLKISIWFFIAFFLYPQKFR